MGRTGSSHPLPEPAAPQPCLRPDDGHFRATSAWRPGPLSQYPQSVGDRLGHSPGTDLDAGHRSPHPGAASGQDRAGRGCPQSPHSAGRAVRSQQGTALAASLVDLSSRPPPIRLEVLGLPFGRGDARFRHRRFLEEDRLCRHAGLRNDRNGCHHQPCPPLSTRSRLDRQTHARPGDQAGRTRRNPGAGPQRLTRLLGGGGRLTHRPGGLAANRGPGPTGRKGKTSISGAGARKSSSPRRA